MAAPRDLTSDLRKFSSPRQDQRSTSTCTAQGCAKMIEVTRIRHEYSERVGKMSEDEALRLARVEHDDVSILAIYFLGRELMDPPETHHDDGCYVSLVVEAARRFGVCLESLWPFEESRINLSPPWRVMRSAYKNKIAGWTRIASTGNMRIDMCQLALAWGKPVEYGIMLGQEWMDYGPNSEPLQITKSVKGGHATVLVGWDPKKCVFIGENSWGSWGKEGFYEITPEAIASSHASDFVVVTDNLEDIVP